MAALRWSLGPRPRSHTLHSEAAVLRAPSRASVWFRGRGKEARSVGGHPVFLLDRV